MALFSFGKPQRIDVIGDGGVMKTILKAGDEDSDMPSPGERAYVHFTGTLESTGEVFDCSRAKARPFSFKLDGRGHQGGTLASRRWPWESATPRPARLRVRRGGPARRVLPDATLRFDVELLSLGDEPPPPPVVEGDEWRSPRRPQLCARRRRARARRCRLRRVARAARTRRRRRRRGKRRTARVGGARAATRPMVATTTARPRI